MCDSLAIANFHKWFKDMVRGWIRMAMDKCKDYTAKAVAADSTTSVTNDVMFSTSALDTTGFLIQVGSFWKHLEWPVASVAYGHAVYVMQAISECALFYVGEVVKKLGREDMFDENGRFRASEKVSCNKPALFILLSLSHTIINYLFFSLITQTQCTHILNSFV